jgi:hypothetical protein
MMLSPEWVISLIIFCIKLCLNNLEDQNTLAYFDESVNDKDKKVWNIEQRLHCSVLNSIVTNLIKGT